MTKQERHILYKRMLREYRKILREDYHWGLCAAISRISQKDGDYYRLRHFDELMNYQPEIFFNADGEETDDNSQFWFPMQDTKSRIDLLKKVIKETK